jgi:hypothetical protein
MWTRCFPVNERTRSNGRSVFCAVRAGTVGRGILVQLLVGKPPCGGGFEYIHHSTASRRRRRKENAVPSGYNWATLFLRDVNTGT